MKLRISLVLACLAACVVWAVAPAVAKGQTGGIRKAELDALAKELEGAAENWIAGKPADAALENKLKAVTYDDQSIGPLVSVLSIQRKDPVDLYVTTRLLGQLAMAKVDVIRKALPSVKPTCQKLIQYQDFPKYSDAELKALKVPESGLTIDQTLKLKEEVQKRQETKLAKEKALKLHNEQTYKLEKLLYKLMVLAADPKEDDEIAKVIERAEQQGLYTFADVVELVRSEVPHLDAKRAQGFYDDLKNLGARVLHKKANYTDRASVYLNPLANSGFETKKDVMPGIVIFTAVNQIATAAKLPALKVPTKEEVDKANSKPPPKRTGK